MLADDFSPISAAVTDQDHVVAHENGNGVPMQDAGAVKAKKTNHNRNVRQPLDENTALHRRYGRIGISAVAAAVRYQGSGKNSAYAPATSKWQDHSLA